MPPVTYNSNTFRHSRRGAALALCVCISACSSDTTESSDPLNDDTSGTGDGVTVTNTASATHATASVSTSGNQTTSGSTGISSGPTTGSPGTTTGAAVGMSSTGDSAASTTGAPFGGGPNTTTSGAGGGDTSSSSEGTEDTANSSTATTGGDGTCEKGTTVGSEVLMIGESFIAFTHEITHEIERQARANGSLDEGESYRDNSVSGTTLAGGGNSIPNQYQNGVNAGPVKYVLMDGGGNDCLQAMNPDGALAAAETLFENMAANGTEKVQYFFYPDPIGSNFNGLKNCLDELRPQMQALCEGLTSPQCYWIDLRETWDGHPEYTDDGIHPTTAGSVATGQAIWAAMVDNCIAQ